MNNEISVELESFPAELRLLLALLGDRAGRPLSESDGGERFQGVSWEYFIQLTMHHRVYPQVYLALEKMDEGIVPPHVLRRLHKEYCRNTILMLGLCKEMEHVCALLAEHNIQALLLKGPALALDLYGDLSLRTSRDLDILISLDDLQQVDECLSMLGYVREDKNLNTIFDEWKWRQYHITYFHPEKRVAVEVHWRLGHGPGIEPGFNQLWERRRAISLTYTSVYYLGREDLFLYLVSHGARHGWFRLRWLQDIHQLLKQEIRFDQLLCLLKKYQCAHLGGQALILASRLLETAIQPDLQSLCKRSRSRNISRKTLIFIKHMENLHTEPSEQLADRYKRYIFSIKSLRQKILFVLSFLHPYPRDAELLPLPKRLHFLYFPLRPVLWAVNKNLSDQQKA